MLVDVCEIQLLSAFIYAPCFVSIHAKSYPICISSSLWSSLPCASSWLCRTERLLSFMLCSHRPYGTPSLHELSACHRLPGPIYAYMLVLSLLCQSAYASFPLCYLAGLLLLASISLVIISLLLSFIRTCPEQVGNIIFRCKFNASRLHASTG